MQGDRLRVRRAIPAVVDGAGEALGIAAGEGVFGLGKGAHIDALDRVGLAEDLLRDAKRSYDFVIFRAAGGNNASDMQRAAGEGNFLSRFRVQLRGQTFAEQHFARIVTRPIA